MSISEELNDKNGKYAFGLFGSFAAREVFRSPVGQAKLSLEFQFRQTNIISLMSAPVEFPGNATMPDNPFRAQMIMDDFSKEFACCFSDYAQEVQFLCVDLLEERFVPVKIGDSYVTMSDSYMDAAGIDGAPLEEWHTEIWEKSCLRFIEMLKTKFSANKIFLLEFHLAERFESAGNPCHHPNASYIRKTNNLLRIKYAYFKKHFKGIHVIRLSQSLGYTDKYHEYGCLPEHYNGHAYQYVAEQICRKIGNISCIPQVTIHAKSEIRRRDLSKAFRKTADYERLRDARKYSGMYQVMRDWMYKKIISRPIDKYLIENKYMKIALYGMGEIGKLFLWDMRASSVNVAYAIDKNADNLFSEIPLFKPEGELPGIDAIVVCVPFGFEEIKQMLAGKVDVPILSIDRLIYEA